MQATGTPFNVGGWRYGNGTDIYTFTEMAVSNSTTISFGGMGNGTSFIGVDGVVVAPISTWTWFGGTGAADNSANWTLTSGSGN